ncbi:unnamed protein product [Closterium sp. NIES-54]
MTMARAIASAGRLLLWVVSVILTVSVNASGRFAIESTVHGGNESRLCSVESAVRQLTQQQPRRFLDEFPSLHPPTTGTQRSLSPTVTVAHSTPLPPCPYLSFPSPSFPSPSFLPLPTLSSPSFPVFPFLPCPSPSFNPAAINGQQSRRSQLVGRVVEFEGVLNYYLPQPIKSVGAVLPKFNSGYSSSANRTGSVSSPSVGGVVSDLVKWALPQLRCHGPPCPAFGSCTARFPNVQACWNPHLVDEPEDEIAPPINCPLKGDSAGRGKKTHVVPFDESCSHKGDFKKHGASALQMMRLEDVFVMDIGIVLNRTHLFLRNGCTGFAGTNCQYPSRSLWQSLRRRHLLHPSGIPLFNPDWTYRSHRPLSPAEARSFPSDWVVVLAKRAEGKPRAILNFREVEEEVVRRFGRERVVLFDGSLPILQARALFMRARLYIASHGAGFTNMIFMPEQASVLEIRPQRCPTHVFNGLAAACSLRYHLVFSQGNCSSTVVVNVTSVARVLVSVQAKFQTEDGGGEGRGSNM